jgi:hypothetical protein
MTDHASSLTGYARRSDRSRANWMTEYVWITRTVPSTMPERQVADGTLVAEVIRSSDAS